MVDLLQVSLEYDKNIKRLKWVHALGEGGRKASAEISESRHSLIILQSISPTVTFH